MASRVQCRGESLALTRAVLRRASARLGLGLILSLLLLPTAALAGRVAVLDFGGGTAGRRARAGLVRELVGQEGMELVSASTFAEAGQSGGVAAGELTTGSGIRRAAAVAMVDLVVSGTVSGKGARARIWIDVWDADGQQRLHKAYKPTGGQLRLEDLDRITAFLIRLAPASEGESDPPPRDDPPPPDDPYDPGPIDDPPPPDDPYRDDPPPDRDPEPWDRGGSGVGGRIDDPRSGRGDDPDDWAREPPRDRGRPGDGHYDPLAPSDDRPPFVTLYLLGQAATRDYLLQGSFTTVEYRTQGVFPEVGFLLEAAPVASGGPWVEELALEARGSYGFLASQFEDSTGVLQRRPTPVIRLAGDLRYRVPLAPSSAYSPRLGVRAGYYLSRFQVALGNPLFRTVTHSGLRVGVDLKQPLLPPFVVLRAWAALLPLSSPGVAEAAAYGPQASTTGFWVSVGFVGSTEPEGRGLTWMLSLEAVSQADRFAGTGSEDANATASEKQIVVSGGVGYAF